MRLYVQREPTVNLATMGVLFVDGHFFGFTLEDAIREIPGQPVAAWKVAGATAIPSGTYPVTLTHSPHFGRVLPLVGNVPGFEGIRIHPGNGPLDTAGCLLVGKDRLQSRVLRSLPAFMDLYEKLADELGRGQAVTLTIANPLGGWSPVSQPAPPTTIA